MPSLSATAVSAKPSGIRIIAGLTVGMDDVLHMEIGEPLFSTPNHIVEAACKAMHDGWTKYLPNAGIQPLRKALSDQFNADYGLSTTSDNVVVTIGGVEAVYNSVRTICDVGDEIILPEPIWPNGEMIAHICNLGIKRYKLDIENGGLPDFDELKSLVTQKTKAIYINSPSNPMGTVFPAETIRKVVEFARKHDIYVISDEVYHKLVYGAHKHVSAKVFDTDDRVVVIGAMSKTYAMTGWRCGYAIGNKELISVMIKLQESCVTSVPGFVQWGAYAAITGPQDIIDTMREAYSKNRAIAKKILEDYGISHLDPAGAFYIWINAECTDSYQFAKDLLYDKKVALAPGEAFGESCSSYVRVSLASPYEVVKEGVKRLSEYIVLRRK